MGLVDLLRRCPDSRAAELLQRLVGFQTRAVQDNGQYAHIGFQVGEVAKIGLIHNAVPNVALAYVATHGRAFLAPGQFEAIGERLRASFGVLDQHYCNDDPRSGVCNQEYARTWSRMLYGEAFGDPRWRERAHQELHQFIAAFHRRGWPDFDCAGTLRSCYDPSETFEPAEYYGLMIEPLLLGWRLYGDAIFIEEAIALARHIARSAWVDTTGNTRLHRQWFKTPHGYQKINGPMCISGAGHTAAAIHALLKHKPDAELADFIERLNATYAHYQHPAGFFLSATGWQSELDVAPSTAWHAHDFFHFAQLATPDESFWDTFFEPRPRAAVLLGHQCFYIEQGAHWAIESYLTHDDFQLYGRKDHDRFFLRPIPWVKDMAPMPPGFDFPEVPDFWKTDEGILLAQGDPASLDIASFELPFLGTNT
ncbi:MAG TPA: hypothetical protein VK985_04350 [Rariglobus sp.]|nr:hypothetical protein [Rariglobus sp.]